jgi:ribosomal protein S18 acetylase RimI-like enzyme
VEQETPHFITAAEDRFDCRRYHAVMSEPRPTIRRASAADLPVLGRLGASLLSAHYAFDARRFMSPDDDSERGYAWFLGQELSNDDVIVLVAELDGEVVGYVYAGIEGQNWRELREEAGFIHDVVVTPEHRSYGVGGLLVEAAADWCRERGMPRVLLWAAEQNTTAQRLFARAGFRRTMVEMTREL